jgi:integrase
MAKRRSFGFTRKLPSGRVQASYAIKGGTRVTAPYTFLTERDADAWLSLEYTKLQSGTWVPPHVAAAKKAIPTNFADYAKRHIKLQTTHSGDTLRKSTKDLYERLLRTNLSTFSHLNVEDIDSPMISEWWVDQIRDGKKTQPSKAYKLLSAVLKRAAGEKLIPVNPCMVKGATSAITGKQVQTPTPDDLALVAAHINPRYKKLVILAAYGGFRFGEITELRRRDVALTDRNGVPAYEISVTRAVTLVRDMNGKYVHLVGKPKSEAGSRVVKITSKLTPMIDELLSEIGAADDSLLFPAKIGPAGARGANTHQRHDVFMNSWRPALKRAGIEAKKYAPHGLRHFAGTYLHRAGANIPELKAWLGDSTTTAVMRYIHPTDRGDQLVEMMVFDLEDSSIKEKSAA